MYLTPGRNPVNELLESQIKCHEVMLEEGVRGDQKIQQILARAKQKHVPVSYVGTKKLSALLPPDTPHQGVIATAERFSPELSLKDLAQERLDNQLYIYVREALYEHNAAAIIRSAECLGISGVIFPPKMNITPNMTRVAMGANFHIKTTQESLFNTIRVFRTNAYQIVGIEISGAKLLSEIDFRIPSLLIVGGEDRSLGPEVVSQLDHVACIHQSGKVNSLNMSVAASIAMYQRTLQLAQ